MNMHVSASELTVKARTTRRVRLGDILKYEQPTKYLVESTDYSDGHPTPVLTAGKSFVLGYTNETHGIYTGPFPVIIFDDFTTSLHLVDFPFKVKSSAMKILRPCDHNISLSLVIELIRKIGFQPGDHKRHWISEFQDFEIDLPVGEYHDFVAQTIASADAKIDTLKTKKSALEEYKRGLMQKLFSREIRFTREDGSDFPEWTQIKAGDLFRSVSNKRHDGDLPILSITQEGGAVLRSDVGIDIKATAESVKSYKIVEKGDFIISLRSFQGGIEYSNVNGICSPAYTILKPNYEIVDGFYSRLMKTNDFISRLSLTVVGIRDGKQISFDAFSTLALPYPSIDEQALISDALEVVDQKIDAVFKQCAAMEVFKKGLLQKLFA